MRHTETGQTETGHIEARHGQQDAEVRHTESRYFVAGHTHEERYPEALKGDRFWNGFGYLKIRISF